MSPTQIKLLRLYSRLLNQFGPPGPWPWFGHDQPHTPEEIALGAILTQNTSWHNVQAAISNLRLYRSNTLTGVYRLGKTSPKKLKSLIRPAGFYNRKSIFLLTFCQHIIENHSSLKRFFRLKLPQARLKLLGLKGIGPETADTILLYSGNKRIFVIDAYTRRFVSHYHLTTKQNYTDLQQFFQYNLPKKVKLYQNFHALIVRWGKEHSKINPQP